RVHDAGLATGPGSAVGAIAAPALSRSARHARPPRIRLDRLLDCLPDLLGAQSDDSGAPLRARSVRCLGRAGLCPHRGPRSRWRRTPLNSPRHQHMERIEITCAELVEVRTLTRTVAARYGTPDNHEFLNDASAIAHELPRRLRQTLCHFRLFEPASAMLVISGWKVDDDKIGPTPEHWQHAAGGDTREDEMFFL